MIILVKYTALQWDNHQGGQGRVFENTLVIEVNKFEQLNMVYEIANIEVKKAVDLVQFGQSNEYGYKILSIELTKPIGINKQIGDI